MNITYDIKNNKNNFSEQENQRTNEDIKSQAPLLLNYSNNNSLDYDIYNISKISNFNSSRLIKQPLFELELIYREKLELLNKEKTHEELLNKFIDSEVNNILLEKQIENFQIISTKLESKIFDLKQENVLLKNQLNNEKEKKKREKECRRNINENNKKNLTNRPFVENELNIKSQYNNMNFDALKIKEEKK